MAGGSTGERVVRLLAAPGAADWVSVQRGARSTAAHRTTSISPLAPLTAATRHPAVHSRPRGGAALRRRVADIDGGAVPWSESLETVAVVF